MRKTHLPIADPCHENWDAMDPVERGRFCHQCSKQVHDLSAMTEREAKGLLAERAGERICVRYGCDAEGSIRFRPEQVKRVAVLAVALAACAPHDNPEVGTKTHVDPIEQVEPEPLMGSVMPEPVEPEPDPHMIEMGDIEAVDPEPVDPEPVERIVMGEAPAMEMVKGDVVARPIDDEIQPCALTKPGATKKARGG